MHGTISSAQIPYMNSRCARSMQIPTEVDAFLHRKPRIILIIIILHPGDDDADMECANEPTQFTLHAVHLHHLLIQSARMMLMRKWLAAKQCD